MRTSRRLFALLALASLWTAPLLAADDDKAEKKKIVFVAGKASHGWGQHEHHAGCLLLAKGLKLAKPGYTVEVVQNGWPKDESIFDGADVVIMYADGGGGHPVIPHEDKLNERVKKGLGVVCIHYGVEVPKGKTGDYFLEWIGGYFETHWSVNPHWKAEFKELPKHPITQGVKPFSIDDEWYYHMRFRPEMKGVTPILTAIPPESTLQRGDGPHSGNPHVRAEKGQPQHVAWASERADGGRGFGFTGGHFHQNWGNDNFRRTMLNAIVWVAKGTIPEGGVESATPNEADLDANQDEPKPEKKK